MMIIKSLTILSLGIVVSCESVIYDLSDADYIRMPELFVIDDYNKCMLHSDALYCSVRLELYAEPGNKLNNQIQEYSTNSLHHYNHSILDREVCMPETCREYFDHTTYKKEDLGWILEKCFNNTISKEYTLYARVLQLNYCISRNEKRELNNFDIIGIFVITAILAMNIIGSVYQAYFKKNVPRSLNFRFLTSFSIYHNVKDLFKKSRDRSINGLNGLRIIALLIVVAAHTFVSLTSYGDNVQYVEKLQTKMYYKIFSYGIELVQVCFALSGFLLAYKIRKFEDTNKISWKDFPKIFFLRLVRLTPSYAVVMLFFISLVKDFGSGALWKLYVGASVRDCKRFFWHHMFYINNYVAEDVNCSIPTWHAAADTQLFILGLLVLCLTKKRRILVLSILLISSLIGPLADVWIKGLDPVAIIIPELMRNYRSPDFNLSHIRGHNNLTCFLGAMIAGLFVFEWQKQGFKIKNKFLVPLSNLLPLAVAGVFLSIDILYINGLYPSMNQKLVFAAAFRLSLSAVLAFLLISIAMNFDSLFCRFVSWPGWEVPSKLCYGVFLIHMNIISVLIGSRSAKENISAVNTVVTFLGVTVLSFMLAIFLYVLVEAPFSNMLNIRPKTARSRKMKLELKGD